ncbi:MAG: hypothetical protein OQL06_12230 [Gammaproteobacteria bacterium]|nr:hypothetical protein [Gammaproteobacteria bacterium]
MNMYSAPSKNTPSSYKTTGYKRLANLLLARSYKQEQQDFELQLEAEFDHSGQVMELKLNK